MNGHALRTAIPTPPGLSAIYSVMRRVYPGQPNPLQVTAVVKYWLGGPDPLDFISMYANPGRPEDGIPPHWHYVSCGLSDLHGDGRVHDITGDDGPSGFGFELTFRLQRDITDVAPPAWPAQLMQNLARYVFQSENTLCSGDHVSWHVPLDFQNPFIQQMLISEDPQLKPVNTPFGSVDFMQIVGICTEELQAAQHWNGPAILELLKHQPITGGPWLISNVERTKSIFDYNSSFKKTVEQAIAHEGSNLSGVSAKCWWTEWQADTMYSSGQEYMEDRPNDTHFSSSNVTKSTTVQSSSSLMRDDHEFDDYPNSRLSNYSTVSELITARPLNGIELRFNLEAAALLPLAVRGRLLHCRHFTFKSVITDLAITLVSAEVTGTNVNDKCPYAACGNWVQVRIPDDFVDVLIRDFEELSYPEEIVLPKEYVWPKRRIKITIVEDSN